MNAPLRSALALSALIHALVCVWGEVRGKNMEPPSALPPDRFSGDGIELETIPAERAIAAQGNTKTLTPEFAPAAAAPTPVVPPEPRLEQPARKPPRIPVEEPAEPAPPSNTEESETPPAPLTSSSASRASERVPDRSAAESQASRGESPANPTGASATYGAPGLPPGVRHLPRAFTRALALANRGDTRWREVEAGRVGEARLVLPVDEEGQLGELEYASDEERERLAPVVKKLFANTLLLLKNGRFSVDPKALRPGVTRLRVAVEVTDGGPRSAEGDPVELFGLASAAPEPGKPGKSGFVLNSGRQVTAWVWLE